LLTQKSSNIPFINKILDKLFYHPYNTVVFLGVGMSIFVDKIHKSIHLDDTTNEIINIKSIKNRFERLNHLKQLGSIFYIHKQADHSIHQHSLGVFELADRLNEVNKLPKSLNINCLKYAAIFHCIGHLTLSRGLEKFILILSNNDTKFRRKLKLFIDNAFNYCIDNKLINNNYFDNILNDINCDLFYRLLSVKNLIDHKVNLINIIGKDYFNLTLKYLIDPDFSGFKLLLILDKLDYLIRDLFNIGIFYPDINIEYYLREIKFKKYKRNISFIIPSEFSKLLNAIENFAFETIYNDPKSKILQAAIGQNVMKLLKDNYITINDLYEKDETFIMDTLSNNNFDIYEFLSNINNNNIRIFKPVQIPYFHLGEKLIADNICRIELKFAKKKRTDYLSVYFDDGVICSIENIVSKSDIDTIKYLQLFLAANISIFNPNTLMNYIKSIYKYVFGLKSDYKYEIIKFYLGNHYIKCNIDRYRILSDSLSEQIIKSMNIINPKEALNALSEKIIFLDILPILGRDYFNQFIKYSTYKNPEFLSSKALKVIQETKLENATANEKLDELKFMYNRLLSKNVANTNKKYSEIFVFNSVIVNMNFDKEEEKINEFDGIVIYFCENEKPFFDIIEISKKNKYKKAKKDTDKMYKLSSYLNSEFGNKILVRTFFNDERIS